MPELISRTTAESPPVPTFEPMRYRGQLTRGQHDYLMNRLRSTRIAKRSQGGRQLAYLEAWDVRAHLIRIFGFGNFDAHVVEAEHVYTRDIEVGNDHKPGWEVAYKVVFHLSVFDRDGLPLCSFTEAAVGSASGASGLGDLHDNALKSAASDALKRCAINLGTQFGLSLYDDGSVEDVVKTVLVRPYDDDSTAPAGDELTDDQAKTLERSLGAQEVTSEDSGFPNRADTPEQAQAAAEGMRR